MSTKADNVLNPHSCFNRARNDEPIFVLRASDPLASELVTLWANRYSQTRGLMNERQRLKFNAALAVAKDMKDWAFDNDDIPF